MNDLVADYRRRHPRSRDPERAAMDEAEAERLRAAGVPMGGYQRDRPGMGRTLSYSDQPYPLICVCAEPVPEWVYVAHQCATCARLIVEPAP